jgi:hypothetical protein
MKLRHHLTIIAVLCSVSFYEGTKNSVKTITKEIMVETQVPVCAPLLLPARTNAKFKKAINAKNMLAAAIPQTALRSK